VTRLVRALPALTLVAVLVVTATSEFRLAVDVLALPPWVAWGVPAAVDSYVVAAVRTRRDVAPAMGVMAVSLFAAAGSHIVQAHTGGTLPIQVTGPASAAMLSVLVLVAWRVHVLIDRMAEPVLNMPAPVMDTVMDTVMHAEEEPRTSPALPAITPGASTPPSDASPSAPPPEAAPASAPARRPGGTSGRSGGGRKAAPRLPALTDAEALEIGVQVFRDTQPANRDEYARAFRAVRAGESSVIKRSYTPAREAAAKPQLQAV
jgi:hypothetical protein